MRALVTCCTALTGCPFKSYSLQRSSHLRDSFIIFLLLYIFTSVFFVRNFFFVNICLLLFLTFILLYFVLLCFETCILSFLLVFLNFFFCEEHFLLQSSSLCFFDFSFYLFFQKILCTVFHFSFTSHFLLLFSLFILKFPCVRFFSCFTFSMLFFKPLYFFYKTNFYFLSGFLFWTTFTLLFNFLLHF